MFDLATFTHREMPPILAAQDPNDDAARQEYQAAGWAWMDCAQCWQGLVEGDRAATARPQGR